MGHSFFNIQKEVFLLDIEGSEERTKNREKIYESFYLISNTYKPVPLPVDLPGSPRFLNEIHIFLSGARSETG